VRPRHAGELPGANGVGESGHAACGDVVRFAVVVERLRVREVRYQAFGCAACIAAGSALAEMVGGEELLAAARVSRADVEDSLGGPLPPGKEHALTLVLDALHGAFEDYLTLEGEAPFEGKGRRDGCGVVAAMSGGVDSAVSALLLKEAGYDVAAVTFRLHDGEKGSRSCCSPDTVLFARDTAHRMGLAHFTLDLKELFGRRVMKEFVGSYGEGRTPNPCVACNAHVKFHAAASLADRLGFEYVATGHYARVVRGREGPALARPADEGKDQTYVLWPVPGELLARTIFPLGEHRKTEVREIAVRRGLAVAYTPESQDICFIPDGDYRSFVRNKAGARPGDIVDRDGRVLGRHAGVVDFTVGQRRGIGLSAPTPLYVSEVRPSAAQIVVGRREDLETHEVRVRQTNWFLEPGESRLVQVRYNGAPVPCELERGEADDEWVARLAEPVAGVAPGQSAVFYTADAERVVGGGVVSRRPA
jgi:tRNA-uridine 2-sulfurtransferase